MPIQELMWVDRSQRPVVGMLVTAYFEGGLQTVRVTEWMGDRCYFTNSYFLTWSDRIGFSFR